MLKVKDKFNEWLSLNKHTYNSFCKESGIAYCTLNSWLKGKRSPRKDNILAISKATKGWLSYEDFIQ